MSKRAKGSQPVQRKRPATVLNDFEIAQVLERKDGSQELIFERSQNVSGELGENVHFEVVESESEDDSSPNQTIEQPHTPSLVDHNSCENDDERDRDYEPDFDIEEVDLSDNDNDVDVLLDSRQEKRKSAEPRVSNNFVNSKGKKDDEIWENFTYKKDISGKKCDVSCRHCMTYSAKWPKVERLRNHLKRCKEVPSNLVGTKKTNTGTEILASGQSTSTAGSQVMNTIGALPAMVKVYELTEAALDKQVAKYIFSANLSFSTVENPEFSKLLKMLKPSYKIPSRKQIGSTLLDQVYNETTQQSFQNVIGKQVTVMQDGWTASQSSPVISHSLSVECTYTHFMEAIATTTSKKTTEYWLELLMKAISEVEGRHQSKVIGTVTDNTNAMIAMRTKLTELRPDIFTSGCNTHLISLVGKAVSKDDVLEDVRTIQHFFKDHTYTRETLKKKKTNQPVLPNETRWGSQYACFKNFIKNHSMYLDVAKDKDATVPSDILMKLMDFNFFNAVQRAVKNLRPIAKALKSLQRETATIAHAVKFWIDIIQDAQIPVAYEKRFEEILVLGLPSFACAAYLLHPKFRGERLPSKYTEMGLEWIERKNSTYVVAQMKLSQCDGNYYFAPLMNNNIVQGVYKKKDHEIWINQVSGSQWWRDMGSKMGTRLPIGLAALAQKLQLLPASSSGIERCFSTMGSIMTDERNNIGVEKASKLCSIYRHLHSNSEQVFE